MTVDLWAATLWPERGSREPRRPDRDAPERDVREPERPEAGEAAPRTDEGWSAVVQYLWRWSDATAQP